MKHIFWNIRVIKMLFITWALHVLIIFFSSVALGANNITDDNTQQFSLYRNDTLYLVDNDLGKLVNSIWELDTDSTQSKPIIVFVTSLPSN